MMACSCGTVKVAFARLRAASALKLRWGALLLGSLIFFGQFSNGFERHPVREREPPGAENRSRSRTLRRTQYAKRFSLSVEPV